MKKRIREVYQDYSKVKIQLHRDITVTLNIWKCLEDEKNRITTYALDDDYTDYVEQNHSGELAKDSDYVKFLSYLEVDSSIDNWWTRSGQVISEEERTDEFGDYYGVYKFHYVTSLPEGDTLHIIPFDPINFELINE